MASSSEQQVLTLKREDYSGLLIERLGRLLIDGHGLVDVTLACEGQYLQAHRLVLASCSPLFKELLANNPSDNPVVILDQAKMRLLKKLINFLYTGEVTLTKLEVHEFTDLSERLGIRGLAKLVRKGMIEQERRIGLASNVTSKSAVENKDEQETLAVDSDEEETEMKEEEMEEDEDFLPPEPELVLADDSDSVLTPSFSEDSETELIIEPDVPHFLPSTSSSVNIPRTSLPSAKEASTMGLTCDICNSVFKRKNAIKHHILKFHPGQDTGHRMACNLCGMMFELKSQVRDHKRLAHDDQKGDRVLCVLCNRTFKNNASLKVHMCCYHNRKDAGQSHACKTCGKTFLVKCDVRRHERSVHALKPRVTCNICQHTFKHKNSLRQHMLARHKNKGVSHKCQVCHKSYQRNADLIRHTRNEHRDLIGEVVSCDYCQRTFKHKDSLHGHIWRYHKDVDPRYNSLTMGETSEQVNEPIGA